MVVQKITRTAIVLAAVLTVLDIAAVKAHPAAYRLATFSADVTPPLKSPLCGGLVKPATEVSEPLQALGIVILGTDHPIVLCAVDWCEIRNEDHALWRSELARAANTLPDHVAVHSLHQHNAPIADSGAERLLLQTTNPPAIQDSLWMKAAVNDVAKAITAALPSAVPLTHAGSGEASVINVASNRRVMGPDGRVQAVRTSATRDPDVRAAPEGTIDPLLKTICFWNQSEKLAVLHYYGTHPMSYYGDGVVSSDFVGIAREKRTAEDHTPHIYFTGCGGNVTAGKYNDGHADNRPILANRILEAMRKSEATIHKVRIDQIAWEAKPLFLPPNPAFLQEEILKTIHDPNNSAANRIGGAMKLSYVLYAKQEQPVIFSCLRIGSEIRIIHLPGEPFIEYQLNAQQQGKGKFVATAGYGDGGCGYIPLEKSFAEGGYEPTWAFAAPAVETPIQQMIGELLKE